MTKRTQRTLPAGIGMRGKGHGCRPEGRWLPSVWGTMEGCPAPTAPDDPRAACPEASPGVNPAVNTVLQRSWIWNGHAPVLPGASRLRTVNGWSGRSLPATPRRSTPVPVATGRSSRAWRTWWCGRRTPFSGARRRCGTAGTGTATAGRPALSVTADPFPPLRFPAQSPTRGTGGGGHHPARPAKALPGLS
jgi:hypothetical protein